MTYCVAMRLAEGLVFASDSRTNAGFDQISTFRKMHVFEKPGERQLVLLSAGNRASARPLRPQPAYNPSLIFNTFVHKPTRKGHNSVCHTRL